MTDWVWKEPTTKETLTYLINNPGKCFITCPYDQPETCKLMMAEWDSMQKKWYVPRGVTVQPFFDRWPVHCRVCNNKLFCKSSKDKNPCQFTKAGVCCMYYGGCNGVNEDTTQRPYRKVSDYSMYIEDAYFNALENLNLT
jgi:hypothetical protein